MNLIFTVIPLSSHQLQAIGLRIPFIKYCDCILLTLLGGQVAVYCSDIHSGELQLPVFSFGRTYCLQDVLSCCQFSQLKRAWVTFLLASLCLGLLAPYLWRASQPLLPPHTTAPAPSSNSAGALVLLLPPQAECWHLERPPCHHWWRHRSSSMHRPPCPPHSDGSPEADSSGHFPA